MLAPPLFAMASKKIEEKCSQELTESMWLSVIENFGKTKKRPTPL